MSEGKPQGRWRSTIVGQLGPVEVSDSETLSKFKQRYTVLEVLGIGGMGEVKLVRDQRIGREVAAKTLRPELLGEAQARQRFIREAHIQGQLEHPAVVPVYDLAESTGGEPYFTMRRVYGQTLAEIIEGLRVRDPLTQAAWSKRKLLAALSRVCLAVHFAHSRGVVHRDLKPENIMLGEYGEVYIVDWGLAKLQAAASSSPASQDELTEPGNVVGTPLYMAPEQILEGGGLDLRSDVYALGCVLFELLTKETLKSGDSVGDLAAQTIKGLDARASRRLTGVAADLDAICVRATKVNPAERFQTAKEMSDAIERHLDAEPAPPAPPSPAAPPAAAMTASRDPPTDLVRAPPAPVGKRLGAIGLAMSAAMLPMVAWLVLARDVRAAIIVGTMALAGGLYAALVRKL